METTGLGVRSAVRAARRDVLTLKGRRETVSFGGIAKGVALAHAWLCLLGCYSCGFADRAVVAGRLDSKDYCVREPLYFNGNPCRSPLLADRIVTSASAWSWR